MNLFLYLAGVVAMSSAASVSNFQMGTTEYGNDIIADGVPQEGWDGTEMFTDTMLEAWVWLDVDEEMVWNGTTVVSSDDVYYVDQAIGGTASAVSSSVSIVFTCKVEGSDESSVDLWMEDNSVLSFSFTKECMWPIINLNLVTSNLDEPVWFIQDGVVLEPTFETSELQNWFEIALSSEEDRLDSLKVVDAIFNADVLPALSATLTWDADSSPGDTLVVDDPSILNVVYHCNHVFAGQSVTGTLHLNVGFEDPIAASYTIICIGGAGWSSGAIWGFVFFWAFVICLCCSMAAFWSDDATVEEKSSLLNTPAVPVEGDKQQAATNPFDDPVMSDPANKEASAAGEFTALDQNSTYARVSGWMAQATGRITNRGPQDFQKEGYSGLSGNEGGADAYHSQL